MKVVDGSKMRNFFRDTYAKIARRHPAVLRIVGWNVSGGDLVQVTDSVKPVAQIDKLCFLYGIARGMKYVHEIGIVHGNLGMENIFCDECGRPIIANFGRFGCDSRYVAPEAERGRPADVFSFGVIATDFLTAPLPEILRLAVSLDPSARPTFGKIVQKLEGDHLLSYREWATFWEKGCPHGEDPDLEGLDMALAAIEAKQSDLSVKVSELLHPIDGSSDPVPVSIRPAPSLEVVGLEFSVFLLDIGEEDQSTIKRIPLPNFEIMVHSLREVIARLLCCGRSVLPLTKWNLCVEGSSLEIVFPTAVFSTVDLGRSYSATERMIIAYGIASGCESIHATGMTHSDLRLENILLDARKYPRISGFGHNEGSDCMVDVYAFGIVLWELVTGSVWTRASARPGTFTVDNALLVALMEMCWADDKSARPSFAQILKLLADPAYWIRGTDEKRFAAYQKWLAEDEGIHAEVQLILSDMLGKMVPFRDFVQKIRNQACGSELLDLFITTMAVLMGVSAAEIDVFLAGMMDIFANRGFLDPNDFLDLCTPA
jgi:serine/threonine protein kinase